MQAIVLAALLCSSACARESLSSLTAPTPDPAAAERVTLTVRVLETVTEHAIAGANVLVDDRAVGHTNEAGTLTTQTVEGREVRVQTTADGYRPSIIVSATPGSGERWTFYLEAR